MGEPNVKDGSQQKIKQEIKQKVMIKFKEELERSGLNKSKVKFLIEGKGQGYTGKREEYIKTLNRTESSIIFKARTRML